MSCIGKKPSVIFVLSFIWISNNGHNWSHHHYFHYGSNNPEDITCFNFDKFVTLPWFILMTAGLSLSCSNKSLNNFLSKVISK